MSGSGGTIRAGLSTFSSKAVALVVTSALSASDTLAFDPLAGEYIQRLAVFFATLLLPRDVWNETFREGYFLNLSRDIACIQNEAIDRNHPGQRTLILT